MSKRRENLESIVESNSLYHVESWYEKIKDFTFLTEFLDLSLEEAKAIVRVKDARVTFSDKLLGIPKNELQQIREHINNLKVRIDQAIERMGGGAAFVRLSSRSPKDAAMTSEKMRKLYDNEIKKLYDQGFPENSSTALLIAFNRSCGNSLKVMNGEEAVDLLTKSQRTYEDLSMAFNVQDVFNIKIIVRNWVDILQEWEFRVFVSENEIKAITQYYSDCFVPEILARKQEIQEKIFAFFQSTKHLTELIVNFAIDYVIDPLTLNITIVEVNNPPPIAGMALFNDEDENDLRIVKEGPFEFRVLEKEIENPLKYIGNWLEWKKKVEKGSSSSSSSQKRKGSF